VKYLMTLSKSELVQLAHQISPSRVHRGMTRKQLAECVMSLRTVDGNPFDDKRRIILDYLKKNWDKVRSQIDPRCPVNCFEHSDAHVLMCWMRSAEELERHAVRRKGKA